MPSVDLSSVKIQEVLVGAQGRRVLAPVFDWQSFLSPKENKEISAISLQTIFDNGKLTLQTLLHF